MSTKNRIMQAVVSCFVAATLWGLLWYPMRTLEGMGISGVPASLLVYLAALVPLIPFLYRQYNYVRRQPGLFLLLALAAGWANLGFILAVLEGTVVRVLLLFYLSPVWTVILGWIILQEKPTSYASFTLCMALAGAVVMLWQPDVGLFAPLSYADVLAISSGFAFSVMNVVIRKAGSIPILFKMVPAFVGVIFLSLLVLIFTGETWAMPPPDALLLIFAVGSVGMVIMTFTAQFGVSWLPVYRSATIFLFEIVVGAISAALLAGEMLTLQEWCGGTLIILAAFLSARETNNSL